MYNRNAFERQMCFFCSHQNANNGSVCPDVIIWATRVSAKNKVRQQAVENKALRRQARMTLASREAEGLHTFCFSINLKFVR